MPPSPRVTCDACAYAWYGETVAHGLRIVGRCPRCDGSLSFRDPEDAPLREDDVPDLPPDASPAAVLGTPTSWLR